MALKQIGVIFSLYFRNGTIICFIVKIKELPGSSVLMTPEPGRNTHWMSRLSVVALMAGGFCSWGAASSAGFLFHELRLRRMHPGHGRSHALLMNLRPSCRYRRLIAERPVLALTQDLPHSPARLLGNGRQFPDLLSTEVEFSFQRQDGLRRVGANRYQRLLPAARHPIRRGLVLRPAGLRRTLIKRGFPQRLIPRLAGFGRILAGRRFPQAWRHGLVSALLLIHHGMLCMIHGRVICMIRWNLLSLCVREQHDSRGDAHCRDDGN